MKIIDIPQSGKEGLTVSFPLSHSQAVHHADGNPANNDLDNLLLLTAREHNSLHRCRARALRLCPTCRSLFAVLDNPTPAPRYRHRGKFCSVPCASAARRKHKP